MREAKTATTTITKKTNVITAFLMDIIKVMASVKLIYVVFGSFCLSLKKKVF